MRKANYAFSIPIGFAKEALVGAWRSLVAHLFWVQGVGCSNHLAPTTKKDDNSCGLFVNSEEATSLFSL